MKNPPRRVEARNGGRRVKPCENGDKFYAVFATAQTEFVFLTNVFCEHDWEEMPRLTEQGKALIRQWRRKEDARRRAEQVLTDRLLPSPDIPEARDVFRAVYWTRGRHHAPGNALSALFTRVVRAAGLRRMPCARASVADSVSDACLAAEAERLNPRLLNLLRGGRERRDP